MKFTVAQPIIAGALDQVSRVVERRNTYPILANVRLQLDQDVLTIRATDLDIEIQVSLPVATAAPGITTVPASLLHGIVKKLSKDAEVLFETTDDEHMTVKSGRSRFSLATLPADSFPDLKSGNFTHTFEMTGWDLASSFGKVAFAISNEETRYYLNGIYVHTLEVGRAERLSTLRMVATDGHRMARLQIDAPAGSPGMPGIIVPKKTVAEVSKLAEAAGSEAVTIEVSESKIRFSSGRWAMLSKLIEGTFPDYERVTPKDNNHVAIVNGKELLKAVDRVATVASDRGGKAVKITLESGLLKLEVSNPDHGTATEEIAAQFEEEKLEIGFNAKYLENILDRLGSGSIVINVKSGDAPALITSDADPSLLTVLMPMRV